MCRLSCSQQSTWSRRRIALSPRTLPGSWNRELGTAGKIIRVMLKDRAMATLTNSRKESRIRTRMTQSFKSRVWLTKWARLARLRTATCLLNFSRSTWTTTSRLLLKISYKIFRPPIPTCRSKSTRTISIRYSLMNFPTTWIQVSRALWGTA